MIKKFIIKKKVEKQEEIITPTKKVIKKFKIKKKVEQQEEKKPPAPPQQEEIITPKMTPKEELEYINSQVIDILTLPDESSDAIINNKNGSIGIRKNDYLITLRNTMFYCDICNKQFKKKYNRDRHIKDKNIKCNEWKQEELKPLQRFSISELVDILKKRLGDNDKTTTNVDKIDLYRGQFELSIINIKADLSCAYCDMTFTRKFNRDKHIDSGKCLILKDMLKENPNMKPVKSVKRAILAPKKIVIEEYKLETIKEDYKNYLDIELDDITKTKNKIENTKNIDAREEQYYSNQRREIRKQHKIDSLKVINCLERNYNEMKNKKCGGCNKITSSTSSLRVCKHYICWECYENQELSHYCYVCNMEIICEIHTQNDCIYLDSDDEDYEDEEGEIEYDIQDYYEYMKSSRINSRWEFIKYELQSNGGNIYSHRNESHKTTTFIINGDTLNLEDINSNTGYRYKYTITKYELEQKIPHQLYINFIVELFMLAEQIFIRNELLKYNGNIEPYNPVKSGLSKTLMEWNKYMNNNHITLKLIDTDDFVEKIIAYYVGRCYRIMTNDEYVYSSYCGDSGSQALDIQYRDSKIRRNLYRENKKEIRENPLKYNSHYRCYK